MDVAASGGGIALARGVGLEGRGGQTDRVVEAFQLKRPAFSAALCRLRDRPPAPQLTGLPCRAWAGAQATGARALGQGNATRNVKIATTVTMKEAARCGHALAGGSTEHAKPRARPVACANRTAAGDRAATHLSVVVVRCIRHGGTRPVKTPEPVRQTGGAQKQKRSRQNWRESGLRLLGAACLAVPPPHVLDRQPRHAGAGQHVAGLRGRPALLVVWSFPLSINAR